MMEVWKASKRASTIVEKQFCVKWHKLLKEDMLLEELHDKWFWRPV